MVYVLISITSDDTGRNIVTPRAASNDKEVVKAKLVDIIFNQLNEIDDDDAVTVSGGLNSETNNQYIELVQTINGDGYIKVHYEIHSIEEIKQERVVF